MFSAQEVQVVSAEQDAQLASHLVQAPYLAKVPFGHCDSVTQVEPLKA